MERPIARSRDARMQSSKRTFAKAFLYKKGNGAPGRSGGHSEEPRVVQYGARGGPSEH
jgi:hypothetical protein